MNAVRKWSVMELQSIEDDFYDVAEIIRLDNELRARHNLPPVREIPESDAGWLEKRIETRALNGTFGPGQCDSCGITGGHLRIYVDELRDSFGSPPDLSVTYLCTFCR